MSAEKPTFNPDTTDLDRMHAAARRESADVPPGQESTPMWVIFAALIVLIVQQIGRTIAQLEERRDEGLLALLRARKLVSE